MTRKEGFIEVDKILQEIGVDTTDLGSVLGSKMIHIVKDNSRGVHFSFDYKGETYFYKLSFYVQKGSQVFINPYNELVAEELAKDYGIPCIDYDLALLGANKGVISKNFKQNGINYRNGSELLLEYYKNVQGNSYNTLENIWDALEYRYYHNPSKKQIISYLMKKIVDIYLFDIIVCHSDRHSNNWQIMESKDNVDIAPLYDNERIMMNYNTVVCLGVNFLWADYENLWKSIGQFQKISSEDFTNIIKDKLWIISEENLNKVFERIEKKTGYPMPEERKEFYLSNYKDHKKRLEEILGLAVEREENNERKNR